MVVLEHRLYLNVPGILGSCFKYGLAENSIVRDVELVLNVKAYVSIYTRALVPPSLGGVSVDVYRDHVRMVTEIKSVGYIERRLGVRAERTSHQRRVYVKFSVDARSFKDEHKFLIRKRLIKQEGLAVPGVILFSVSVGVSVLGSHFALCVIVVRKINLSPFTVSPDLARRLSRASRLCGSVV